jgi:uncharacterized protein YfcZ (UPF0381/DUF406 family)
MSNQGSLADSAVSALAEIKKIMDDVDINDPMRHTIYSLQLHAERALSDGIQQAQWICNTAIQLKRDIEKSEVAVKTQT